MGIGGALRVSAHGGRGERRRPLRRSLGRARATERVLAVEGLAKSFGGVDAVREVSFAVAAGELVALIGPNGAGKTTCFNLINGQLRPDARNGDAGRREDRRPAAAGDRTDGRGRTFQVAATFASMTVRENVQLALLSHAGAHHGIAARATDCVRAEADALLERVRMAPFAEQGCATLAYGDAKRVELALALAGKPRLLLMDEPTAGMSPRSRGRLMQLAADFARAEGSRCFSPSTTWTSCSGTPTA